MSHLKEEEEKSILPHYFEYVSLRDLDSTDYKEFIKNLNFEKDFLRKREHTDYRIFIKRNYVGT